MSKKKKRHSQPASGPKGRSQGASLADENSTKGKRFKPAARNLLFLDLVFLAGTQWLDSSEMLSEVASGICTLIGVGLLLLALWIQFGNPEGRGGASSGSPRLK